MKIQKISWSAVISCTFCDYSQNSVSHLTILQDRLIRCICMWAASYKWYSLEGIVLLKIVTLNNSNRFQKDTSRIKTQLRAMQENATSFRMLELFSRNLQEQTDTSVYIWINVNQCKQLRTFAMDKWSDRLLLLITFLELVNSNSNSTSHLYHRGYHLVCYQSQKCCLHKHASTPSSKLQLLTAVEGNFIA